ncbi:DUF4124 domain-containing protein [Marinobacter salinisoli]|uniref:DUF4124 domain-containing protein n=1 Tax=Marinobacter salinisoli TaxID=2769486 RepID=A0ABX7MUD9_9GAMM|nr:DUF4124 domain-containing protein [Marinobacter salinisoli]QSP95926.1 DUF4124 domain-containing protein [Marinobacter salinisoli]
MPHHSRPLGKSAIVALAFTMGLATTAEARMYRYTDDNGQIVISNTIPQAATKRGYEILGSSGRVVETVAPAPTAEEIAAREAEAQRQKELAIQREKDRQLLRRYSHPDQAVEAMHRKVRQLEGLIQIKRGNISVLASQLENEQGRAADLERAGREIPDAMLGKINRLESKIDELEAEIRSQNIEIDLVRADFETDITRLEQVTGEPRTLPLELSKAQ